MHTVYASKETHSMHTRAWQGWEHVMQQNSPTCAAGTKAALVRPHCTRMQASSHMAGNTTCMHHDCCRAGHYTALQLRMNPPTHCWTKSCSYSLAGVQAKRKDSLVDLTQLWTTSGLVQHQGVTPTGWACCGLNEGVPLCQLCCPCDRCQAQADKILDVVPQCCYSNALGHGDALWQGGGGRWPGLPP